MPAPRPSIYDLERFLLGTLPPADAARVAEWVEADPTAARALERLTPHDAVTRAVTDTAAVTPIPRELVERVVTGALRATDPNGTRVPAPAPAQSTTTAAPAIGAFRVVRRIGGGGMGEVFEAHDDVLKRRAAIKVLRGAVTPDARERFLREARHTAAVDSPHVVRIYQVGETDAGPFVAMEFIPGTDLKDHLSARPDPLPVPEALRILRAALTGLAAAHAQKLIHRDLKPSNLMIATGGTVKVVDFGLAREVALDSELTRTGAVIGTPEYMSPQQAAGKPLDARTDVYSMGVVLYQMLSGRSPFRRDTVYATLFAVANEPPEPLTNVPAAVRDFVARLMAPDASARPEDAAAALAELTELERALAEPALPPRGTKPRRGRLVALGALAAALVLALGVIVIVKNSKGEVVGKFELPDGYSLTIEAKKKGEPKPPAAEPKAPAWPAPGARGVFTDNSFTYEEGGRIAREETVPAGTTFELLIYSDDVDQRLCRVLIDGPERKAFWVPKNCVRAKD
jgi:serine/threonine protein kinase